MRPWRPSVRGGYEQTSLDALAGELGIRKQTILYHFSIEGRPSRAVIDEAGSEVITVLEEALATSGRVGTESKR